MPDTGTITKEDEPEPVKTVADPPSAESTQLLHLIAFLNIVRLNIGMYPHGHLRITESIDHAFEMIQNILREKTEFVVGFSGDSIMFGETASEREKKNDSFRDYARSLNNLRIVSFTLHRGVTREDIREFNRILATRPADIWGLGEIESVFSQAGINGIKIQVIDAAHFNLDEKKGTLPTRTGIKPKEKHFWPEFLTRVKPDHAEMTQNDSLPGTSWRMDPLEAVRILNGRQEHWPSAVASYEKMVHDHFTATPEDKKKGTENSKTLTDVNALFGELNPELKRQLIEVVERQMLLHPETDPLAEDMRCFPEEIFKEIIRQTNERGEQISPTLVNLLKKMASTGETPASSPPAGEEAFSSREVETLLNREEYESYVPKDYDRLLKKASENGSSVEDLDESRFPLQEHLKTLARENVDLRVCQLALSLMDEPVATEDYLACLGKLERSIPELLKEGQFLFLTALMGALRRHAQEKNDENVRQKAVSLLQLLSEKESVAKAVTPFVLYGTGGTAVLTQFLISSEVHHIAWLFDLYLDPEEPLSETLTEVMKGFGKIATGEAIKRLSDPDTQTNTRLHLFIRELGDKSIAFYLKSLFNRKECQAKMGILEALIHLDDPAVIELLKGSLKSRNENEVLEAVRLSCRYRVVELLDDLADMLKTPVLRKENIDLQECVVAELAKTGHPSVIPVLDRISSTRFSFSPEALHRMKMALYSNIRHFPENRAMKLLLDGYASRDKEVRAICEKILENEV